MDIYELTDLTKDYHRIVDALAKVFITLRDSKSPMCSISGGSDSDIMLDMVNRLDESRRVRYVWFNTGLEYSATKRHIAELEEKYKITIERVPAIKSIPECVKEFGQPFLSKFVSERISQLQLAGFDFSDMDYKTMRRNFPNAKNAADWWHNRCKVNQFNINWHKHLKNFLIANPPKFRISEKCCKYAKKQPARKFVEKNKIDVQIVGVRKAEGGIRSMGKYCTTGRGMKKIFRPLFWFTDRDKETYSKLFGVEHSACYTIYGLKRTGCAGCPFNPNLFHEINLVQPFEPYIINAALHLFHNSYLYSKLYRLFILHCS